MLSREEKARLEAERDGLKAYWKGGCEKPYLLEHHGAYHVCDVLFPSTLAHLRWPIRAFLVGAVSLLPLSSLKIWLFRLLGAKIGQRVYMAPNVLIDPLFPSLVEIGDDCFLGMGCKLFAHEYTTTTFRLGRVRVGRGSVIGGYSVIRGGVSIGENVTVGFLSYVNKDVPDGETVVGIPARPLKKASD